MSSSIPQTIKAFVFPPTITQDTGPRGLYSIEIPTPQPGPDDVLVKVHAVSLNYRDVLTSRGLYLGVEAKAGEGHGVIPTSDAAGEVVAVGSNVTRWKVGDRVTTLFLPSWQGGGFNATRGDGVWGGGINGTLAEYISHRADAFMRLPSGFSYEEGATLPGAALTAYSALFAPTAGRHPDTKKEDFAGQSVLIQGSGGVSVFAAQLAAAAGASRIFVTSSSDEKLARYRQIIPSLGEDDCVNYKTTPNWGEEVLKRTKGQGIDHIIEVGGANTLSNSIKAVGYNGNVHIIGVLGGIQGTDLGAKELANTLPFTSIVKSVHLRGVFVGSRLMHEGLIKIIESASIKPVIDKVFPFEQSVEAFERLETGGHFGKIVIKITE